MSSVKHHMRKKGKKGATSRPSDLPSTVFDMDRLSEELSGTTSPAPDSGRVESRVSQMSSHRNSPSRIPLYVANGLQAHHSPNRSRSRNSSCDLHPSAPSGRLLPDVILRQQQQHNLSNHMKNPTTTKSSKAQTGSPVTPVSSRRTSSGISDVHSTVPFDVHAGFRYEDYMPLCQLQKGLEKGQVVEGILRINPKNYEDAYISAPGEAMDIYVAGVTDRNRSLHGDRVAIQINPSSKWRILYETMKCNWTKWQKAYENESSNSCPGSKSNAVSDETPVSVPSFCHSVDQMNDNCERTALLNITHENVETEKTQKKKRNRKHNRAKKKESVTNEVIEPTSTPILKVQTTCSTKSTSSSKKTKKKKKSSSKAEKKELVTSKKEKSSTKLNCGPKSSDVNGLPREIYAMTADELIKLSFGPFCVQKSAKVVHILKRNHSLVAGGKISLMNDSWVKFSPQDSRIPRIRIPVTQIDEQIVRNIDHNRYSLFLAKITEWPAESPMPTGELTKFLGESGDIEAESQLLLMENKVVDEPFPTGVEQHVSKFADWTISSDVRKGRRDFTSTCVFTIDPATARDLDDALSIVPLNEKRDGHQLFEVGVHIADVAYFVEEGSPLDLVACERSTSFYLVQRVIPMLPRLLCERLCSLTPGQEKLSFSVVWKMDENGKIYETNFGRSVIKSCVKLAYEHAQEMIENPDLDSEEHRLPELTGGWTKADVKKSVLLLHDVAQRLRKKRFDGGALKIDKVKFNFVLDGETGLPAGFAVGLRQEANFLVEEFMLQANMSVGEKILSAFPSKAILRRHPPPDDKQMRDIRLFCEVSGVEFNTESAGSIHAAMQSLRTGSPANSQVVSLLLLKAMKNALYFCSGSVHPDLYSHYALNVPIYTHFTSPIRRYPDILVHRMLAASLGYQTVTEKSPEDLQAITTHCNDRKQASRLVSEGSQRLFLALYLQSTPLVEEAVVNNVLDRAFDVIVLKFGLVSRVYMDQLSLEGFRFDNKSNSRMIHIKWPAADGSKPVLQTIQVSSLVKVRLSAHAEDRTKIQSVLMPPAAHF